MAKKEKEQLHTFESYQPHLQPVDKPAGRFTHINAWLKKHNKQVLVAVAAILILVGSFIAYLFTTIEYSAPTANSTVKKKETKKFYSPLTGHEVGEEDSKRPVIGVMIENSPESRPQSGVKEAGVVFESVAEGGITRFLLLYQEANPAAIGPIRSVRAHFASLVAGFDAGLAHVGGSDIPLKKLRSGQIKDLDQFFNANAYIRVYDRAAPHNVYSSGEKLRALSQAKGYSSSNFTAWKRSQKLKPAITQSATVIDIPISTGQFAVNYTWDQDANAYARNNGGKPHTDREQGQIAPKVVIAMQVPHDAIRDSNNFSYPDVNTSGKAWIFQNGSVEEITWSKPNDGTQISFKNTAGADVELNPGQTWISLIKPSVSPTWK